MTGRTRTITFGPVVASTATTAKASNAASPAAIHAFTRS
jgi:hypothetical protein